MLDSLDIALLFDNRTTDSAGNIITKGCSGTGISAQLGDGVVAATMPTMDLASGRAVFDGGDYMRFPTTYDVDGVLANMGGIQAETYLFVLDPVIINGTNQYILAWNTTVAASTGYILIQNTNTIRFIIFDGAGNSELLDFSAVAWNGRRSIFAWVREPNHASEKQRLYIDSVKVATANQTPRDARNNIVKMIGCSSALNFLIQNTTGLKAMAYARRAFTQLQLQAIQKYLRGNL